MSANVEIKVGDKYGKLTIVKELPRRRHTSRIYRYVECKCQCGNIKAFKLEGIRSGDTKSCGCLALENLLKRSTTHGHSARKGQSRTYISWFHMKARCLNKKDKWHQKYYSDIKMCKRWLKFENFLLDMGERPTRKTLDRINCYQDYKPSNCRWATHKEQMNNLRKKAH